MSINTCAKKVVLESVNSFAKTDANAANAPDASAYGMKDMRRASFTTLVTSQNF